MRKKTMCQQDYLRTSLYFTADAVRAAGGGSVDRGADIMYKTMKTLENKVA